MAEVVVYGSYQAHDARFHWATHFLVGLAYTALLLLGRLMLTGAPGPRFLLLTVLGFHLYAMAPDLHFRGGIPHYPWMNVFLGHVAAHYVPGGDTTWLIVALACTGLYVLALTSWLRARRAEGLMGMPPGVGLTGMAVLRPQHDPRTHELEHRNAGHGRPWIVLVHGLGASSAFWAPVAAALSRAGCRTTTPDLLGFAGSIRLGTHFHLNDQAAAVIRLVEASAQDGGEAPWLVAHSYGAAVAVAVARARPDLVRGLVLVAPAAFADPEEAAARIGGRSWLARKALTGSVVADLACGSMCLLRRPLTALAPRAVRRVAPGVPPDVARDAVRYVWPAYRDALASLLKENPLVPWLRDPRVPTSVVLGRDDVTVPAADIQRLVGPQLYVTVLLGTHSLPIELPEQLAGIVVEHVTQPAP
ncbi:MAG: alpha/beta hydrolase [Actinobacteria bacterium]|nr:alpha/beta hydrolase [Actinomycetota bacterium]